MKVLIIDDDPIVCAVLESALRSFGFCEILVAESGLEATELYYQNKSDVGLISCDLHMPDFDGIEFISFLSQRGATCPIVFVTSANSALCKSAQALSVAGNLNCLGVLKKPIDVVDLERVTRDIVPANAL